MIATTAGNRGETFAQLEWLRIHFYVVNPTTMGTCWILSSRLGALTGHEVPAARLVAALDTRIRMVLGVGAMRPRADTPVGVVQGHDQP